MNVILFAIPENMAVIKANIKAIESHEPIAWATCIIMADSPCHEACLNLSKSVEDKFGKVVVLKHPVGEKPLGTKMVALIAQFIIEHYNRFPGECLFNDGTGVPAKEGWLEELRQIHRDNGKHFTGRFKGDLHKGVIAVGPVIIDAPGKVVRVFRHIVASDWRERGRWIFARNHHNIHHAKFPMHCCELGETPKTPAKKS